MEHDKFDLSRLDAAASPRPEASRQIARVEQTLGISLVKITRPYEGGDSQSKNTKEL